MSFWPEAVPPPKGYRRPEERALRDYFAGEAMKVMLARGYEVSTLAAEAYRYADAMIAERNKQ